MEKHFEISDEEFEQRFKNCEFEPVDFTHEAHLRLAWIHINKYGVDQALKNIQDQLKQFVEFAGAKDKYNTTLTIAATKAVFHFIMKSDHNNFRDFIHEFPQLKFDFKELMESHYGFDIFNSAQAKNEYMEPDLMPFD